MNRNIIIALIISMLALAVYKFHTHLQSPTVANSVVIQSTSTCTSDPGAAGCPCSEGDNSDCDSGNCQENSNDSSSCASNCTASGMECTPPAESNGNCCTSYCTSSGVCGVNDAVAYGVVPDGATTTVVAVPRGAVPVAMHSEEYTKSDQINESPDDALEERK